MGIYERDYYREDQSGWWSNLGGYPATYGLMMVTVAVYILQLMSKQNGMPGSDALADWGAFYYPGIRNGQVWRLITPIFLHDSGSLWHIVFNMMVLYWVGTALETVYGTREFLTFYLVSGFVVSVGMFALAAMGINPDVRGIGASGAITAALLVFACLFPHQQVLVFLILPVPVWLLAVGIVLLNVSGAFGLGRTGIGYNAHLIGAAFGFLYYVRDWRVSALFGRFRDIRPRRNVRTRLSLYQSESAPEEQPVGAAAATNREGTESNPVRPVDEHLEAKLDAVLEKVSRYGRESLTPEENDILMRASEIYKRRRGN